MSNDQLTTILAERIMGWTVGPDRFMMGGRQWQPRWRFQPLERVEDAFRLLKHAATQEYAVGTAENGSFWAKVRASGIGRPTLPKAQDGNLLVNHNSWAVPGR